MRVIKLSIISIGIQLMKYLNVFSIDGCVRTLSKPGKIAQPNYRNPPIRNEGTPLIPQSCDLISDLPMN